MTEHHASRDSLVPRTRRTLALMHRWGYAPTLPALAADLIGGSEAPSELQAAIRDDPEVFVVDGFAFLRDSSALLDKSKRRVASHLILNGGAKEIAMRFATELASACPLVRCIALSGSVASGGYESQDDIDLNLFVVDGAKYLVYALALLVGFQAILRHLRVRGFRKLICINVLWTLQETRPFERQDESLAFELLRSRPLVGRERFIEVLEANPWLDAHFPQIRANPPGPAPMPRPNRFGRVVGWIGRHPRALRALDRAARIVTCGIYTYAHRRRRKDPESAKRLDFLQRVKYPYEVFQD